LGAAAAADFALVEAALTGFNATFFFIVCILWVTRPALGAADLGAGIGFDKRF
jgi:hypothetical protein